MSGEWLHTLDAAGMTPLDRAFDSGHMALAEMMLRQERDDQQESLKQSSPLHRAAYLGLADAVRSLLTYGSDPGLRDKHGETPLHKAARGGQAAVIELLAELCDVNAKSSCGLTPLHWACLAGRSDAAEVLVEHGADPYLRDEHLDGLSPIAMAALMGHGDLVKALTVRAAFA